MILTFDTEIVRLLLEDSKKPAVRRLLYNDPSTDVPGLWLVGDVGVYLMSNSKEGVPNHAGTTKYLVAYADQCNPANGPEVWVPNRNASFGPDDGAVLLEEAFLEAALANATNGKLSLNVTEEEVTLPESLAPKYLL